MSYEKIKILFDDIGDCIKDFQTGILSKEFTKEYREGAINSYMGVRTRLLLDFCGIWKKIDKIEHESSYLAD